MVQPRIEIDGARELRRQFNRLESDLKETANSELSAIMKRAAEPVLQAIEQEVPVRSGRLRSSLRSGGGKASSNVKAGTARIPYAGVINYGTKATSGRPSNIRGQHFMETGLEKGQPAALDIIEGSLGDLIDHTIGHA